MSIFDTSSYANSLMGGINLGMKLAQEREAQRQYEQEQAYRRQQDAVAGQRYDQEWAYRQQRDALTDERWNAENARASQVFDMQRESHNAALAREREQASRILRKQRADKAIYQATQGRRKDFDLQSRPNKDVVMNAPHPRDMLDVTLLADASPEAMDMLRRWDANDEQVVKERQDVLDTINGLRQRGLLKNALSERAHLQRTRGYEVDTRNTLSAKLDQFQLWDAVNPDEVPMEEGQSLQEREEQEAIAIATELSEQGAKDGVGPPQRDHEVYNMVLQMNPIARRKLHESVAERMLEQRMGGKNTYSPEMQAQIAAAVGDLRSPDPMVRSQAQQWLIANKVTNWANANVDARFDRGRELTEMEKQEAHQAAERLANDDQGKNVPAYGVDPSLKARDEVLATEARLRQRPSDTPSQYGGTQVEISVLDDNRPDEPPFTVKVPRGDGRMLAWNENDSMVRTFVQAATPFVDRSIGNGWFTDDPAARANAIRTKAIDIAKQAGWRVNTASDMPSTTPALTDGARIASPESMRTVPPPQTKDERLADQLIDELKQIMPEGR